MHARPRVVRESNHRLVDHSRARVAPVPDSSLGVQAALNPEGRVLGSLVVVILQVSRSTSFRATSCSPRPTRPARAAVRGVR